MTDRLRFSRCAWLLTVVLIVDAKAATMSPFQSDGCSLFPDGTPEKPKAWYCCCFKHDVAYWRGGTRDAREQADRELERCVAAAGYPNTAWAMRLGVYAGGAPYWPTGFRWGFGWPYFRDYGSLTPEESAEADRLWQQYIREHPEMECR